MEAWLREHEGELQVTALPFLDRFELLPWYAACDWIAIPSFYDGLPNVLVEAAALGIPMLAARAGGMVDVLEDGRTAFLFDPGDEARCAWALQRAARLDEAARAARWARPAARWPRPSSTRSSRSRATSRRSTRDPGEPAAGARVILYYALGGGLGHLDPRAQGARGARVRRRRCSPPRASRGDPRVTGGLPVLRVPRELGRDRDALPRLARRRAHRARADELIVDSFPGGILGELCGMTLPPARHVARPLRWPAYAARLDGPLPRYDVIYELEPLSASTRGPARPRAAARRCRGRAARARRCVDEPHWLVVHSGPERGARRSCSRTRSRRRGSSSSARAGPQRLPERRRVARRLPRRAAPRPRRADRHRRRLQPDAGDRAPARPSHLRAVRARARRPVRARVTAVLVTGGGGFIGSHLVDRARKPRARRARARQLRDRRRENLRAVAGEIELIEGDVREAEQRPRRARRLRGRLPPGGAGRRSRGRSQDPLASNATNVDRDAQRAARGARRRRAARRLRLLLLGLRREPELPKREDGPPLPISPYAAAKLAGEGYCRASRDAVTGSRPSRCATSTSSARARTRDRSTRR